MLGLAGISWRKEINKIPIRIAEVNGASTPRLRCRRLHPRLHKLAQPSVFPIHIAHTKLQDSAPVLSRPRRTRNVFLLCLCGKDRQHPSTRSELHISITVSMRLHFQNSLVESRKPLNVIGNQTRIDQHRMVIPVRSESRAGLRRTRRRHGDPSRHTHKEHSRADRIRFQGDSPSRLQKRSHCTCPGDAARQMSARSDRQTQTQHREQRAKASPHNRATPHPIKPPSILRTRMPHLLGMRIRNPQ